MNHGLFAFILTLLFQERLLSPPIVDSAVLLPPVGLRRSLRGRTLSPDLLVVLDETHHVLVQSSLLKPSPGLFGVFVS